MKIKKRGTTPSYFSYFKCFYNIPKKDAIAYTSPATATKVDNPKITTVEVSQLVVLTPTIVGIRTAVTIITVRVSPIIPPITLAILKNHPIISID